jgi:hypothetical protein
MRSFKTTIVVFLMVAAVAAGFMFSEFSLHNGKVTSTITVPKKVCSEYATGTYQYWLHYQRYVVSPKARPTLLALTTDFPVPKGFETDGKVLKQAYHSLARNDLSDYSSGMAAATRLDKQAAKVCPGVKPTHHL